MYSSGSTREDHAYVSAQLYACYAMGRDVRAMKVRMMRERERGWGKGWIHSITGCSGRGCTWTG